MHGKEDAPNTAADALQSAGLRAAVAGDRTSSAMGHNFSGQGFGDILVVRRVGLMNEQMTAVRCAGFKEDFITAYERDWLPIVTND